MEFLTIAKSQNNIIEAVFAASYDDRRGRKILNSKKDAFLLYIVRNEAGETVKSWKEKLSFQGNNIARGIPRAESYGDKSLCVSAEALAEMAKVSDKEIQSISTVRHGDGTTTYRGATLPFEIEYGFDLLTLILRVRKHGSYLAAIEGRIEEETFHAERLEREFEADGTIPGYYYDDPAPTKNPRIVG